VLNEIVAYLDHRIDPEGRDLPDTPSGYPEARSAEYPPLEVEKDPTTDENSQVGGEPTTNGPNPGAPKPV
jgi:hypothetical protein